MKTQIALLAALFITSGCASYGKPQFKPSQQAYNKDFDVVWQACLNAVEDQTIDHADKGIREISTKPVSNMVINGNMSRYTTIKISENKPYVVRAKVTATRSSDTARTRFLSASAIDDFSDESQEKELLAKIDAALK